MCCTNMSEPSILGIDPEGVARCGWPGAIALPVLKCLVACNPVLIAVALAINKAAIVDYLTGRR